LVTDIDALIKIDARLAVKTEAASIRYGYDI